MKYLLPLFSLLSLFSCNQRENEDPGVPSKAQEVVDRAIEVQGGDRIDHSWIDFDFRGRHYRALRDEGLYTYERIFTDTTSGDTIRDVLTNSGFMRMVDWEEVELSDKDSAAYASSVNSVIYFALLPYFLNDEAVQKTYLGEAEIKGEPYHKIKVTFREEGGGKDFQDEYVYWFHRDAYTLDYLAYNYEVGGGGARFREAYNPRTVGGIRFVDYINYKPVEPTMEVEIFDRLFEQGEMRELSRIDTENIEVAYQGAEEG